jgi:hypothetical protein
MRNPWKRSMVGLATVLAFSSVVAIAQNAPTANQKVSQNPQNTGCDPSGGRNGCAVPKPEDSAGGPAPVHDLSGTWLGPGEPNLNNRVPPMTAAGQARLKLNIPDPFSASSNDGWKTCDPFGMPRVANNEVREIGFAQMPDRVVILENFGKVWREVWTDGRQLPKNVGHKGGPSPLWYGYSVGHWDGNSTLIVDTVGMDDNTWVDRRGYPHTIDAHATETYARVDHNHMNFSETLEDPAYYTKSFVIAKAAYGWIPGQDSATAPIPFSDEQAYEQICIPSDAIEYTNLLAAPADEDAVTGSKKPAKR